MTATARQSALAEKHPGNSVMGPDGRRLTLEDLPHSETTRWVMRRKAEVVAAVEGGLLTLSEACARYRLTPEEFMAWEDSLHRFGLPGLKASHIHHHGQPRLRVTRI